MRLTSINVKAVVTQITLPNMMATMASILAGSPPALALLVCGIRESLNRDIMLDTSPES
jgi:hypothetical protein